MGVGMCIITSAENADEAVRLLQKSGENANIIGEVCDSFSGVKIE